MKRASQTGMPPKAASIRSSTNFRFGDETTSQAGRSLAWVRNPVWATMR